MDNSVANDLADFMDDKRVEMAQFTNQKSLFDLDESVISDCGTAACIAGWIILKNHREFKNSKTTPYEFARKKLGLDQQEAEATFSPFGCDWGYSEQIQKQAVLSLLRGTIELEGGMWLSNFVMENKDDRVESTGSDDDGSGSCRTKLF